MDALRFRQIHLDFHTSEKIAGVGSRFDPDEFADVLHRAHVDSITCFARCHHGMMYYDSKAFPELIHPGLAQKNLLERQIDALHRRGIRAPIYTTIQWDYYMSSRHPDWVCLDPDGQMVDFCDHGPSPIYKPGFYKTLCVNTPYRDFLFKHVEEVSKSMPVDGWFFDIVNAVDCSCHNCLSGMIAEGLNPENPKDRADYGRRMLDGFKAEMSAHVRSFHPEATIFYNSSHIEPALRDCQDAYSHWELESLPSGDWGYQHFPITARFARTTELDFLSHTGKFHTVWGDFHSFKNPEALEYECLRMLALGSKCLIGDQLDPDGKISKEVYELIGGVYAQVEQKEPWCRGAKAVTDIALFTPEALGFKLGCGGQHIPQAILGASVMLDELGCQFDIVDMAVDFNQYKLLILPDAVWVDGPLAAKIGAFLKNGGKLIATGSSGLNKTGDAFAIPELGVKYVGPAPYSPDFLFPQSGDIGKGLNPTEYVMYKQGLQVEPTGAGRALMGTKVPYFNRTWEHFCSHRHTPSSHQDGSPAVVGTESTLYLMHPVFETYRMLHPRWCRTLIKNAIDMLLPDPLLRHNGPSSLLTALNHQAKEGRHVLHLLHYIPERRCQQIDIIDDIIPLHDVEVSLNLPSVKQVKLVPEGIELPFRYEDGRLLIHIPKIHGHAMLEIG